MPRCVFDKVRLRLGHWVSRWIGIVDVFSSSSSDIMHTIQKGLALRPDCLDQYWVCFFKFVSWVPAAEMRGFTESGDGLPKLTLAFHHGRTPPRLVFDFDVLHSRATCMMQLWGGVCIMCLIGGEPRVKRGAKHRGECRLFIHVCSLTFPCWVCIIQNAWLEVKRNRERIWNTEHRILNTEYGRERQTTGFLLTG